MSPLSAESRSGVSNPTAVISPLSASAFTVTPRGTFTSWRAAQLLIMASHFTRSVRVSFFIVQTGSGPLPSTTHPSTCRSTSTSSTSAGTRVTVESSASMVSVFPSNAKALRSTGASSMSAPPHPVRASASSATPPPTANTRPGTPLRLRVGALVTMSTVIGPPGGTAGRCHRSSLPVYCKPYVPRPLRRHPGAATVSGVGLSPHPRPAPAARGPYRFRSRGPGPCTLLPSSTGA
ncbi:hypothetical protein SMICM17S_04161 [Streptomyces microflavus]